MTQLTEEKLIELGFEKEVLISDDNDPYNIWYKEGFPLYQTNPKEQDFAFATRTREDDSFKSGYEVKSIEKLLKLFEAINYIE